MSMVDAREEEQRVTSGPDSLDSEEGHFIKWVPLVVPMFALVLVVLVYFIGAEVM
jgi:hypothetical protein